MFKVTLNYLPLALGIVLHYIKKVHDATQCRVILDTSANAASVLCCNKENWEPSKTDTNADANASYWYPFHVGEVSRILDIGYSKLENSRKSCPL